jgi:hypothetical protein
MKLVIRGQSGGPKEFHELGLSVIPSAFSMKAFWSSKREGSVGKEMPISRIVVAVPNATVVLLD